MVDAVNNYNNRSREYGYGGLGLAAGAAAGAGYSHFVQKPLLKGEVASDAFIRAVHDASKDNTIKEAGEAAKEEVTKAMKNGDAAFTKPDEIRGKLIAGDNATELAKNIGLKDKKAVEEFLGSETDAAKLIKNLEDKAVTTAVEKKTAEILDSKTIQKAIDGASKLAEDADPEALKKFIGEHKEVFGLAEDADADKIAAKLGSLTDQNAKGLKEHAEGLLKTAKETANGAIENKSIKEGAEEWIKKAAKSVQWKAAGMWAAGVGIAVGLAAYLGAKFTAPKVDPEAEEQANLQAHQA